MATIKKNTLPAYFKPVFCSLLAALIVLLTFFVRIPLGPLTITLNCLPVAIFCFSVNMGSERRINQDDIKPSCFNSTNIKPQYRSTTALCF